MLCFVVLSDIHMHYVLDVLLREKMDFKCAKLCVYICPSGCLCVCLLRDSGAVKQDARPHRSRNPDQRCPHCTFPRDADALTCLGRNMDTFHSIESLFFSPFCVDLEGRKTDKRDRGCQRSPQAEKKQNKYFIKEERELRK